MPGFERVGEEERAAVDEVFQRGSVLFAHGFDALRENIFKVREFEDAFASYLGTSHAQAVSSGTAALKVGLKALGVRPGDEVITQSHTFVATVEAIIDIGARPVIAEIDETLNMDPNSLEEKISERTRAIIPVHMLGGPADMPSIMAIADRVDIPVIEDTAQGLGATINGKPVGTFGAINTFSFDHGKLLTTGEGGMVVSDHKDLYAHARAYHDHGHAYLEGIGRGNDGALFPAFNYRMHELAGAIGLAQLAKLPSMLEEQRRKQALVLGTLQECGVQTRAQVTGAKEAGDSVVFHVNNEADAKLMQEALTAARVPTKNIPDAMRWHFAKHWSHMLSNTDFPRSEAILETSFAMPIMLNTPDEELLHWCNVAIEATS